MMCYPNPCWFQSRLWNLLLRVGVMPQMCNRNKILIQAHQSPNRKSVLCLNVVIRCARDTPLRDSCDSHLLFPLRGEECAECDDCACFLCNLFLYKLFMHTCVAAQSTLCTLSVLLSFSLLNNPLESTLLRSQNITNPTLITSNPTDQIRTLKHTSVL